MGVIGKVQTSEAIELFEIAVAQQISLIQWWASVTFAVIAVSYLTRKNLNAFLAAPILLLYIAFSIVLMVIMNSYTIRSTALVRYLSETVEEGMPEYSVVQSVIESVQPPTGLGAVATLVVMFGVFFGTITYVAHVYWVRRTAG